jgi:hypothetical protein
MRVCSILTRKELFENALTLLEWAVQEVAAGRRIVSKAEGSDDRVLVMSVLSAAANTAERHRAVHNEPVPAADRDRWIREHLPSKPQRAAVMPEKDAAVLPPGVKPVY